MSHVMKKAISFSYFYKKFDALLGMGVPFRVFSSFFPLSRKIIFQKKQQQSIFPTQFFLIDQNLQKLACLDKNITAKFLETKISKKVQKFTYSKCFKNILKVLTDFVRWKLKLSQFKKYFSVFSKPSRKIEKSWGIRPYER